MSPRLFDSLYGPLYDAGVNNRRLAPLGGALLWGADMDRVYRLMARAVACEAGEVVLDIPTGGGVTFATGAPDTQGLLIGADISRRMLGRAARRRDEAGLADRVSLVQANATRLPLADGAADRVCCFNSIHCLPLTMHSALLRECRRVLKPGGQLVGTTLVADAAGIWRLNVAAARLNGFFTPPNSVRLKRQARAAGFRDWESDRRGALLYFRGE